MLDVLQLKVRIFAIFIFCSSLCLGTSGYYLTPVHVVSWSDSVHKPDGLNPQSILDEGIRILREFEEYDSTEFLPISFSLNLKREKEKGLVEFYTIIYLVKGSERRISADDVKNEGVYDPNYILRDEVTIKFNTSEKEYRIYERSTAHYGVENYQWLVEPIATGQRR